jgi:hypothetical protein
VKGVWMIVEALGRPILVLKIRFALKLVWKICDVQQNEQAVRSPGLVLQHLCCLSG